jgi:predicted transcriptional regulator
MSSRRTPKKSYKEESDYSSDNSSRTSDGAPSYASPASRGSSILRDDAEEMMFQKSFAMPGPLEDCSDSDNVLMATQMSSSTTCKPIKKRKVSMSPTDSLVRNTKSVATAKKQDVIDLIDSPSPANALGDIKVSAIACAPQHKSNMQHPEEGAPVKEIAVPHRTAVPQLATNTKDAAAAKPKSKEKVPNKKTPTDAAAPKPSKTVPKAKKNKLTFEDQLLHKIFLSCRPHTLKELAKMMESGEAAVNYTLLSLIDKNWVIKKEFPSKNQRSKELYWANQESTDKVLWEKHLTNFVSLKEIQESRMQLGQLQQHHKQIQQELSLVLQTPSNQELDLQCQVAEGQVQELKQQLQAMNDRIANTQQRSSLGTKSSATTKRSNPLALKRKINAMRDEWRNRKTKCDDFVEQLADGMEKKVKDVVRLLELETDEMVGVKMPPKYPL